MKKLNIIYPILICVSILFFSACNFNSGSSSKENIEQTPVKPEAPKKETTAVLHADKSLFSHISGDKNLSSFATALQVAGLDEILSMSGPYTIFAPDNKALESIPASTKAVFSDAKETFKANVILGNCIIDKQLKAEDIVDGAAFVANNGNALKLTNKNGHWYVNDAQIISDPIACENGVIFLVDKLVNAKK